MKIVYVYYQYVYKSIYYEYITMKYLPPEIVEIIVTFGDYITPHKKSMQPVFHNIKEMNSCFNTETHTLPPHFAYTCWNSHNWEKFILTMNT